MIRQISFYGLISFFSLAGLNHFIDPEFYYPLIPPYFPFPKMINVLSGVLELVLGLGLLLRAFRIYASYGLILLLILFIPAHIYFIQVGGCIEEGLCVPNWIAWIRLIIIHPILLWWIWANRRVSLTIT